MRKPFRTIAFAFVVTLSLLFLPLQATAHPGRTDSRGGHTDHSTGEYHYHHGHPAHDHTDLDGDGDLDCPYDFDFSTRRSSGNSGYASTISTYSTTKATEFQVQTPTRPRAEYKGTSDELPVLTNATVIVVLLGISIYFYSSLKDSQKREQNFKDLFDKEKTKNKALTSEMQEMSEELELQSKEQEEFLARMRTISNGIQDYPPEEKSMALATQIIEKENRIKDLETSLRFYKRREEYPPGVFFAKDGRPGYCPPHSRPYGDLTVYLNEQSGIYHSHPNCSKAYCKTMHLFDVLNLSWARPCQRCALATPRKIPVWWEESQKALPDSTPPTL